jgi:hypothetical protein
MPPTRSLFTPLYLATIELLARSGEVDVVVRCCCSAPRRRRWRRLSGTRWPGCATGVQARLRLLGGAARRRRPRGPAAGGDPALLPWLETHRTSGRRRGPLRPCRWPRWTRQASLPSKPDRGPTSWPPHRPPHGERARRCGWQCRPAQSRSPPSPCGSCWLAPGYRDRDHLVRQRGGGRRHGPPRLPGRAGGRAPLYNAQKRVGSAQ